MIKIFTLFLSMEFIGFYVHAQEIQDSLKHELTMADHDTTRVNIMVELCKIFRLSNNDSALYYGQQAYSLAKEINYINGEISALGSQTFALINTGDLPRALELGLMALEVAKDNHLEFETTPALNSIGGIYLILEDYPKALNYFHEQRKIGEKYPVHPGLGFAYNGLVGVFKATNQLDSASFYLAKAKEIFRRLRRSEPSEYERAGDIEMMRGNYDLALNDYRESLRLANKTKAFRNSAHSLIRIAECFKVKNQLDSSVYYAQQGLLVAEAYSFKRDVLQAATLLSELFESIDPKESLRYHKIVDEVRESLYGAGNIQAIQQIIARDEEKQREIEIAKREYESQLRQYGLLTGVTCLIVIALFLYRNNRNKHRANIKLKEQKKEIQSTLEKLEATQSQLIQSEKMASLGELTAGIAHEIQNPLNFVNNFSEVNDELIEELREAVANNDQKEIQAILDDLKENESKIKHHGQRAEGIVKGMLLHSRTSTGEKEPTDINALAHEYLRLAYHGMRAKDKSFNAEFKTDFDPNLPKINVVPQDIGRVLLNLINNAFQAVAESSRLKAESNDYKPMVEVSTKKVDGNIEIKVSDNGPGIPEQVRDKIFQPFFTTKPTGQGTGLGLSLSYDIIKAHGGDIKVETSNKSGTTFILTLQLNP